MFQQDSNFLLQVPPRPSLPTASHTNSFTLHSHTSSVAHQCHWWAWPWCWQECAAWTLASALLPLPTHGGLKHLDVLSWEKSGQKDETSLLHSLPPRNSVREEKNLLILPLLESAEAVPQQRKGEHQSRLIKINDCYRENRFLASTQTSNSILAGSKLLVHLCQTTVSNWYVCNPQTMCGFLNACISSVPH